mgnify:CR=1 FL=1
MASIKSSRDLIFDNQIFQSWSLTKKLVISAILTLLSAIFQSAGGFLPGVGFLISPFATLPIILATIISLKHGLVSYLLTIFLLFLLEPSELFIFPFTTGLLGLGIGWGLSMFRQRKVIILLNGILLSIGIFFPLYILGFPVLGPITPSIPNAGFVLGLMGFSILYSWLWLEIGLFVLKRTINTK